MITESNSTKHDVQLEVYYRPQIRDVSVVRGSTEMIGAEGEIIVPEGEIQIEATKSYCRWVVASGSTAAVENTCDIRFRYRTYPKGDFVPVKDDGGNTVEDAEGNPVTWRSIPGSDAHNTAPVKFTTTNLELVADESYEVEVGAFDDYESAITSIVLPGKGVFMERDGEKNSLSIGEPTSEGDTVSVGSGMTVDVKGNMYVRKSINCTDTIRVGENGNTVINDGQFIVSKDNRSGVSFYVPGNMGIDGDETVRFIIEHLYAGQITTICKPLILMSNGSYSGVIELSTIFAAGVLRPDTTLKIGIVGERALITGLTKPIDASDAVNKKYVDDKLTELEHELESALGITIGGNQNG